MKRLEGPNVDNRCTSPGLRDRQHQTCRDDWQSELTQINIVARGAEFFSTERKLTPAALDIPQMKPLSNRLACHTVGGFAARRLNRPLWCRPGWFDGDNVGTNTGSESDFCRGWRSRSPGAGRNDGCDDYQHQGRRS